MIRTFASKSTIVQELQTRRCTGPKNVQDYVARVQWLRFLLQVGWPATVPDDEIREYLIRGLEVVVAEGWVGEMRGEESYEGVLEVVRWMLGEDEGRGYYNKRR